MPKEMKDKMRSLTEGISIQIQDIVGNPAHTDKQKVKLIIELDGDNNELLDFTEKNFRTGPGLHQEIQKLISKDRVKDLPKKDK